MHDIGGYIVFACFVGGIFLLALSLNYIKEYMKSEEFAKWHGQRKKLFFTLGLALLIYGAYCLWALLTG